MSTKRNNRIICGDCNEELAGLDSGSADFLLTDPPYGTNDDYEKTICRTGSAKNKVFGTIDWDTAMPLAFLENCFRILKDDRWGVVFTDRKEITTVWNALEEIGFQPRNTFYWIKTNKAPTPRANFKSSVETAVVFTKGKTTEKWRGGGDQDNYYASPFVTGGESEDHPTQKPVGLFEHLIKLFTDEDDVVLDPFIGSGTTAVAAAQNWRNYIGIEAKPEHVETARRRADKAKATGENLREWIE